MTDFNRRKEMLDELGVVYSVEDEWRGEVGPDRKPHDLELFRWIRPPFTAEDWIQLCNVDGDQYMGGCCGTLSGLQDKVNYWFRFEMNHMAVSDLAEIDQIWKNHGDEDWWAKPKAGQTLEEMFEEAKEKWSTDDCWTKLSYVWAIVDGHYRESTPRSHHPKFSKFERALGKASDLCLNLSWTRHLESSTVEEQTQFSATQKLAYSKLLPTISTIYHTLGGMVDEPFEGYALIDLEREGNDNIASDSNGFCLFNSTDDAEMRMEQWQNALDKYKESDTKSVKERFGIRPVRITLYKGLEFTGDLVST